MVLPLMNQINNMAKLPEGKTRLDLVKEGMVGMEAGLKKRGRLVVTINRLKEDPRNERRTFRNMEGLIASIKAVGLDRTHHRYAGGRGEHLPDRHRPPPIPSREGGRIEPGRSADP